MQIDASAFLRGLDRTLDRFERQTVRNTDRLAEFMAEDMRENVAKDTHQTERSIVTRAGFDARGHYVDVFAGGASLALEFGTSKMDADPFVRPARAKTRRASRVVLGRVR